MTKEQQAAEGIKQMNEAMRRTVKAIGVSVAELAKAARPKGRLMEWDGEDDWKEVGRESTGKISHRRVRNNKLCGSNRRGKYRNFPEKAKHRGKLHK